MPLRLFATLSFVLVVPRIAIADSADAILEKVAQRAAALKSGCIEYRIEQGLVGSDKTPAGIAKSKVVRFQDGNSIASGDNDIVNLNRLPWELHYDKNQRP